MAERELLALRFGEVPEFDLERILGAEALQHRAGVIAEMAVRLGEEGDPDDLVLQDPSQSPRVGERADYYSPVVANLKSRRRRIALVVAGFAAVLLALIPATALAHASLVASTPGAGQRLGSAPGEVTLEFSEPLNLQLSRADVVAPDGRRLPAAGFTSQGIQIPLATNVPGVYRVEWTTVSLVDGHVLHGTFSFSVGAGYAGSEQTQGLISLGDAAIALARLLEFAGLLAAVGLLLLRQLSVEWRSRGWPRGQLQGAATLALIGGLTTVAAEAFGASGGGRAGALAYLTTGTPGLARVVRVVAEAATVVYVRFQPGWSAFPLLVAIGALAASGHAAALDPAPPSVALDAIHIGSAGLWAGGILALALMRPSLGWRSPDGRRLLDRFSDAALPAFAITALTGYLEATQEVGSLEGLLSTDYGHVRLPKWWRLRRCCRSR